MSSWAHSSVHPRSAHMTKGSDFYRHVFHKQNMIILALFIWTTRMVPVWSADVFIAAENTGPAGAVVANNCCSSTESPPSTWPACETNDQGNRVPSLRGKGSLLIEIFNMVNC